jgi:predicted AAA+ superfamily ATPase
MLVVKPDLERLEGLAEIAYNVQLFLFLRTLKPETRLSLRDIQERTGMSKHVISKYGACLEESHIVNIEQANSSGRTVRLYRINRDPEYKEVVEAFERIAETSLSCSQP